MIITIVMSQTTLLRATTNLKNFYLNQNKEEQIELGVGGSVYLEISENFYVDNMLVVTKISPEGYEYIRTILYLNGVGL